MRHVGSEDFTWRDLLVFIRESPQESAWFRVQHPEEWQWTLDNLLAAEIIDRLSILVWTKTKDGSKGKNPPDPIPRPGVETPQRRKVKGTAVPITDLRKKMEDLRRRIDTTQEQQVKRFRKKEAES